MKTMEREKLLTLEKLFYFGAIIIAVSAYSIIYYYHINFQLPFWAACLCGLASGTASIYGIKSVFFVMELMKQNKN